VGNLQPDACYLVANESPYQLTDLDLMKFGRVASAAHWANTDKTMQEDPVGQPTLHADPYRRIERACTYIVVRIREFYLETRHTAASHTFDPLLSA
jgi:hypothetical protein